jgi:small redox-active disulfide protein 2
MVTIKILGAGCPKCRYLEQEINEALTASPISYEVIKVTDYAEIMAYGIMSTPGLVINETLLTIARIPKRPQIIAWVEQYQASEQDN